MRKRIGKTVVAVTLAGSMAVTPVFAAPAKESEKQTKESSVSDLQSELERVMAKMADLETKLIAKGEEIQKASKELQQAEEKSAKQYEDMKLRIKYMYEAGDTELEKFINAESAGDALNKAEYVQAVYTYDRDKLQEYVDTKKEIENLKTTLEKDKASLEKMNTELNVKKETLTTTIQTKQAEEQQVLAAAQAVAKKRQTEGKAEKTDNPEKEETTSVQSGGSVQEQVSVEPETPSEPQTPAQPETPSEPQAPAEPETPSEPQTPAEPETPSEPQTPAEPENPEENQSAAQQIVSAAYSFLGIPYVWGGTTTAGFDCSGMVQAAHAAAGISIPRVSWDQGTAGVEVSASEALPGDIVYYGWHVGIYIGNGQMIHAPEEGDVVKISTVDWAAHTFVRCW
ncbi:MAG: NlpC/P60 family protein [Faecalimonas umbilicata]|uniref:C40 family peptidase n=1 Tax=Faecalimonas umbilicata TaxID=1912855 RepID=UPI002A753382|nr:NlpC/P60 family protein [Faecalimonas umbilicata]MDY2761803.1 NlpC/P60 family protein [Faecalimonas umbilicata]